MLASSVSSLTNHLFGDLLLPGHDERSVIRISEEDPV
jgi:hypothetical protein